MNPVSVKIDQYQYDVLRNLTEYYENYVYAHISFSKQMGVEPEPIVALMFKKYFAKPSHHLKFGHKGKTFSFQYPEAKALWTILGTEDGIGMINIRALLDKELTDWKPSYSVISMRDWYNKKAPQELRDTFGNFDEMPESCFDYVVSEYNYHNHPKK